MWLDDMLNKRSDAHRRSCRASQTRSPSVEGLHLPRQPLEYVTAGLNRSRRARPATSEFADRPLGLCADRGTGGRTSRRRTRQFNSGKRSLNKRSEARLLSPPAEALTWALEIVSVGVGERCSDSVT